MISLWDLFSLSANEIKDFLRKTENFTDEVRELDLKPEYFVFLPDYIEITFPHEAVQGNESIIVLVEYASLQNVIKEDAMPFKQK